jgi:hypothetical protein
MKRISEEREKETEGEEQVARLSFMGSGNEEEKYQ